LTPASLGFAVSSALWGTVLGSVLAGPASDKYGRVAALRVLAVLYCISAFGCALAPDLPIFVICRAIGGIAIGGSSVIGPMYIAEIAPADKRGRLVGLFQFNIVFGILVAYFSNYLVGLGGLGDAEWRWKLGVAAVPAVLFFFALFGIPQSPRWLVAAHRIQEAKDVLVRIGEKNPEQELNSIVEAAHRQHAEQRVPLFQRKYGLPIFLAVSLGMFNQLTGINAILYYLNDIFERAGFNKVSSDLQAVAIGGTNLLFTMIAMSMIDRVGRKKLLLTGALGTAACLAGVAIIFSTGSHESLLVWLLVGFIAFFAFSQGAVIWVYLSEVFPNVVRAKGLSLGCFTHWLMNALISGIFPLMAASSGAAPFAFFAIMTLVQFFVVLFIYPETKGRTLESMDEAMHAV
jgi:sugar porter (SP) family MFS transporter